jgi:hypothetical protein
MCHSFRIDTSHVSNAREIYRFGIVPYLDSLKVIDIAWYL